MLEYFFLLYELCFWRHFNAVLIVIFPHQCDLIKSLLNCSLIALSLSPTV